jgi:hypothetical protein
MEYGAKQGKPTPLKAPQHNTKRKGEISIY